MGVIIPSFQPKLCDKVIFDWHKGIQLQLLGKCLYCTQKDIMAQKILLAQILWKQYREQFHLDAITILSISCSIS